MTAYIEFNTEVQPSIDMLRDMLRGNVCEVTFTKVNGDLRTMPCTLKPELLPPVIVTEGEEKKERKTNDSSLAVFVIDINEWRSFRLDSIHSISVK